MAPGTVSAMKTFISEDWIFTLTVAGGKKRPDGRLDCRCGFEEGDRFSCEYACPGGFCPKVLMKAFPMMEAVRSGGSLKALGGQSDHCLEFVCPDGVILLRLQARRKEEV